jgi:hypothetical protein
MVLYTGGSSTRTEDGDVIRITSKLLNILLHPAQSHHLVVVILILYSHLQLGLPSGFFPSGFPTKIMYAFIFSTTGAIHPSHRP